MSLSALPVANRHRQDRMPNGRQKDLWICWPALWLAGGRAKRRNHGLRMQGKDRARLMTNSNQANGMDSSMAWNPLIFDREILLPR